MGNTRDYLIVTASYWGFTLVDGALRMVVLLHFFQLGYAPLTLSFLFLLYEFAGIVANLAGGWLAVRYGIARMLMAGQTLQIAGLLLLSTLDPQWSAALAVAWVVIAQGIAGLAKDFTKTASKSAIKATAGQGAGQLFRWVAWFTGSKNAMKGLGFFFGGLLLQAMGFRGALWVMALGIAIILLAGLVLLPRDLGKAKASRSVRELFAKSRGVNLLAAARVFLFGARDVWFVVGLPLFLYAAGWRFAEVGGFLAAWTIVYGGLQAAAPHLVARSSDGLSREVPAARVWAGLLLAIPLALAILLPRAGAGSQDLLVTSSLSLFALPFAVNSSLHSYLILAYAGSEKAAEDVGFYYAANALGRLIGILLSGALFQVGGLPGCLLGSAALLAACWGLTFALPDRANG
ncbi:MAG: organoarsenical effux MFS transporter ArsJ [Proteobacteria bacterium]|nr:organoarsenical effux MFS transporter ArsJ [Pseudomonadota bacterium]